MSDNIGPRYVIKVRNHELGVEGILVIDNTNLGPGKGGIRMTSTVGEEEVLRLARAMTYKNALAGIPFGGAKAGITFDPKTVDSKRKKKVVEWFARELKPFLPKLYIAGPDINMTEKEMAVFVQAVGIRQVATGKPKRLGGLPHELGSTGFGVAEAVKIALAHCGLPLAGARVAIEGFGNVGIFAARFLTEAGLKIVAVSDSKGTVYNRNGLLWKELLKVKKAKGSVINFLNSEKLDNSKVFTLPVDVLIPAALENQITKNNAKRIKARVVLELANGPTTTEADDVLFKKGIFVVPDILANSGGVAVSTYEWEQNLKNEHWSEHDVLKKLRSMLERESKHVWDRSKKLKTDLRRAAFAIALERLEKALSAQ